ncbi:MAG: hypothetical protein HY554_05400 [Elusimicrobia bacterium]|nr:hypothetical protein [Elusimicrobiota bacterium]
MTALVLAVTLACLPPAAASAAPGSPRPLLLDIRFADLSAGLELGPLVEQQELVRIDNDHDGQPFLMAVRFDEAGALTYVEHYKAVDGSSRRVFEASGALLACPATGARRLDRRYRCGVELDHANGDISSIRLFAPGLDPAAGGPISLIYLRHYAFFSEHKVGELHLEIGREQEGWGLFIRHGGARKRVQGLFLHRASRGIGSIVACVGGPCPPEWSRRHRHANDHLPSVWDSGVAP